MSTTYDPQHPKYLDEADVRGELARVGDVCHGCRRCVDLCTSFPTLFELIDRHDDRDASRLTPAQQDQVVDACFQCVRCLANCPYAPGRHELAVDVPRLMLRAKAMRHATKQVGIRDRVTTELIGRTDLVGRVATAAAPVVNRVVEARPGGTVRKLMASVTGISSVRVLAPYTRQRFSTWFARRPKLRLTQRQARVAVFPTCLVEYHDPAIGQDLVKVYERNGVECTLVDGAHCCGAPFLHAGDLPAFRRLARKNVAALAAAVRAGDDIVVPEPTCGYVLKHDYADHLGTPDAALVAAHTFDAAEYLMRLHKGADTALDVEFPGTVPSTVTYHTPCHLKAQNIGFKSRDLMKLTGANVKLVQQCAGVDGMWGLREENAPISMPMARRLGAEIERAGGEVVTGDCSLANTVIVEQTGRRAMHPLQLLARAYGIAPEEP